MLFTSFQFIFFFIIVCFFYFSLPHKYRWGVLLLASYFFYMSWQPAYALLLAFTTFVSYAFAIAGEKSESAKKKKLFFWCSIAGSLSVLFFFKYFNFFNDGLGKLLYLAHISYDFSGFDILLPVGISFYTFQSIGYSIDVYFGVRKAEKHLGIYALYVSFFPLLLAGPIERSTHLLPQFHGKNFFSVENITKGMKYILWGIFKKVVIADRLSVIVDDVFNHVPQHSGATFIIATFLFAFQLYCDFSGYSDIAKGVARILGYDLLDNFNFPFISKNITEFWRRWHISLSTWLRDYLYTPLLFSKKKWGQRAVIYAIFITFILCGLWHGPKITFIVFGFLQAAALIYELYSKKIREKIKSKTPSFLYDNLSLLITFSFTLFSFIFFRANTFSDAKFIIQSSFISPFHFSDFFTLMSDYGNAKFIFLLLLLFIFISIDMPVYSLVRGEKRPPAFISFAVFALLLVFIILFGYFGYVKFIYFQF